MRFLAGAGFVGGFFVSAKRSPGSSPVRFTLIFFRMQWGSVPKDIFFCISEYLDGRDGVMCQRVSKHWHACVAQKKCHVLQFKMEMHYVRVWDIESLPKTFSPNKLEKLSQTMSSQILTNILWWRYGFNPYMMPLVRNQVSHHNRTTINLFKLEDVVYHLGYEGENQNYMRDTVTGDIMLVNDFYGYFTRPKVLAKQKKMISNFRELQQRFPGLFEWKIIAFPFIGSWENFFRHAGASFHRGSCIQVIFKAQGTHRMDNIRKFLRKWSMPPVQIWCKKRKAFITETAPEFKELETQSWLCKKRKKNTYSNL